MSRCQAAGPAGYISTPKVLFCRTSTDVLKSVAFFGRFPELVRITCRLRWLWSIFWMILTGENFRQENLSHLHFVHHKSQPDWPGIEPGSPRWQAGVAYVSTMLFMYSVIKISVPASQKIQSMSIIRTSRLILHREIMCIYYMNFIGRVTTTSGKNAVFLNITTGGMCNHHWTLKG